MRISRIYLSGYRSLVPQEVEVGPFTVMFGKNNAGKTNLLESIYLMLATEPPTAGEARIRALRDEDDLGPPLGVVYVDLERGVPFDDAILALVPDWGPIEPGKVRFSHLPPLQVCFSSTDRDRPELWFTDVKDYYEFAMDQGFFAGEVEVEDDEFYQIDELQRSSNCPFPKPLFLGWEFNDVDTWATSAIAQLTTIERVEHHEDGSVTHYPTRSGWLEPVDEFQAETLARYPIRSGWPSGDSENDVQTWRIREEVRGRLDQLTSLATDLLPDFLGGSIRAEFPIPTQWHERPEIRLSYHDRPNSDGHSIEYFGRGASRWMGIAIQIALRIMSEGREITRIRTHQVANLSGHILFIDEPEAHLHQSAVASVARWCHRIVDCGFALMVASHHEEFLRASGEDVTFVKVTRNLQESPVWGLNKDGLWGETGMSTESSTTARAIPMRATSTLQELADEIGLHPATALSLQRAILFVEGILDQAVLDEYAGPALDAAGVTIIPIHGTRNLEGLIDGEFTTRLGIKTGILTDNTIPETIWDRSNKKRSGEEKKLTRLIKRFEDQGLSPPKLFGVPEEDLLFALPVDAIRRYLGGPFPGWEELRDECRVASGSSESDSVDWKSYARERYGLPITTDEGVRRVVRALDLAGVEIPSLQNVATEIVEWAKVDQTPNA